MTTLNGTEAIDHDGIQIVKYKSHTIQIGTRLDRTMGWANGGRFGAEESNVGASKSLSSTPSRATVKVGIAAQVRITNKIGLS